MIYLICVPVLGVSAQWLAWRLRLPSILLLLGFGILLGQAITPTGVIENLPRMDETTTTTPIITEQQQEGLIPAVHEDDALPDVHRRVQIAQRLELVELAEHLPVHLEPDALRNLKRQQ